MAISQRIKDHVTLALQDRVLTDKERQVIVAMAMQEGATFQEIDQYINEAESERFKSYHKEQLTNCPKCGAPVPLIADVCPACGCTLRREEHLNSETIQVYTKESDIIRAENERTALQQQNRTRCECGAPLPLVSNICSYCGRVFHKEQDSEQNIHNLIDNIKQSIYIFKISPRPSFGTILKYRLGTMLFYFAAAFIILAFVLSKGSYCCVSVIFLLIALRLLMYANTKEYTPTETEKPEFEYKFQKSIYNSLRSLFRPIEKALFADEKKSPLQEADEVFYEALYSYEKYQRQIETLYGESQEARQVLAGFAAEIDSYKKQRSKHRNLITVPMLALMTIPVFIYFFTPNAAQRYQATITTAPTVSEMIGFSKNLSPLPDLSVDDDYADFINVKGDASLMFDVLYPETDEIDQDSAKYQIRIEPVTLVATGKKIETPDTCVLGILLWDKEQNIVGEDFMPLIIRSVHKEDNVQTMLGKGSGSFDAMFISKKSTTSVKRLKEIADSAYYFTIF